MWLEYYENITHGTKPRPWSWYTHIKICSPIFYPKVVGQLHAARPCRSIVSTLVPKAFNFDRNLKSFFGIYLERLHKLWKLWSCSTWLVRKLKIGTNLDIGWLPTWSWPTLRFWSLTKNRYTCKLQKMTCEFLQSITYRLVLILKLSDKLGELTSQLFKLMVPFKVTCEFQKWICKFLQIPCKIFMKVR